VPPGFLGSRGEFRESGRHDGSRQIETLCMLGSGFLRLERSLVVQWPIDYLVQVAQQILGAGYH
jgi:hypothetical protein